MHVLRALAAAWAVGAWVWLVAATPPVPPDGPGKPVITALVRQEIDLPDLKVRSEYKGFFERGGRTRLEGTVHAPNLTGDEKTTIKITMVSDTKKLVQRVEIDELVQWLSYDLGLIQKEFPAVRVGQDLDPCAFGEALRKAADKKELREEPLDGQATVVYEMSIREGVFMAPIPGLSLPAVQPKRMRVWVAKEDGLPRKVEAYDAKERRFAVSTFREVKQSAQAARDAFQMKVPADAVELDLTDMVLEVLRAQKGPRPKP